MLWYCGDYIGHIVEFRCGGSPNVSTHHMLKAYKANDEGEPVGKGFCTERLAAKMKVALI